MKYENLDFDIKQVQEEQVKILLEFHKICSENNIPYQLFAGTLLGSIRHKGFIPWDDDIDVAMLRSDYNYFINICKKNLDSKYFLQTYKTDENYIMQFAKLRKNNTIFLEESMSDLDIHHGVYIDIFPLDNIELNTLRGEIQQKLLYLLNRLNLLRSKKVSLNTKNVPMKILRLGGYYLIKMIPKFWTDLLLNKIAGMFNNKEVKYVSHLTNGASKIRYEKYMMEKSEFYNTIEGEFEKHSFPIPVNYEEVLSKLFGDYTKLPPKDQQKPHHGIIDIKLN